MSVPKCRRNESHMEFLNNYEIIRREVFNIINRDLGVKSKAFVVDELSSQYKMEKDDEFYLNQLVKKYNISEKDVSNQMAWIIDKWKSQLMDIVDKIGTYIITANNIHIITFNSFENRVMTWDYASASCYKLIQKLQEIVQLAHVKSGAYRVVIEAVNKELMLINGLRVSDRKKYNSMVKNGTIKREEDIDYNDSTTSNDNLG